MDLILKPFNGIYFICWAITIALIIVIWEIFKDKSEKAKKIFIVSFCFFLIVVFFVYKLFLSVDKEFLRVSVPPIDKFNWFGELPLHLCNINMFLIPIGVLTKKRGLLGFSFFVAPLGAIMALIFPENAFVGYSVFLPRMIGFYTTHFLIVVMGISLSTLGFYRPKFKDFPKIFLTFICLAFIIHCVNLLFIKTGICTGANYFFTIHHAGISILTLFYKLIPCSFLYLLPANLILFAYMAIISLGYLVGNKLKLKKEAVIIEAKEKVKV